MWKRNRRPSGELAAGAVLTNEQAEEVRFLRQRHGMPQWALAERYGVSRRTIRDVLDGVTYPATLATTEGAQL